MGQFLKAKLSLFSVDIFLVIVCVHLVVLSFMSCQFLLEKWLLWFHDIAKNQQKNQQNKKKTTKRTTKQNLREEKKKSNHKKPQTNLTVLLLTGTIHLLSPPISHRRQRTYASVCVITMNGYTISVCLCHCCTKQLTEQNQKEHERGSFYQN